MTFGKRQLVIASLVVALGAAVYLNWQFSEPQELVELGYGDRLDAYLQEYGG